MQAYFQKSRNCLWLMAQLKIRSHQKGNNEALRPRVLFQTCGSFAELQCSVSYTASQLVHKNQPFKHTFAEKQNSNFSLWRAKLKFSKHQV